MTGGAWAGVLLAAGAAAPLRAQARPDAPCDAARARCLDTVAVTGRLRGGEPGLARTTVTRAVHEAREAGAGSVAGLLQQLPLVQLRAARGETAVALRGARREQVLVTLDGLPLNDPATGVADVNDLPLALLAGATVRLGADGRRYAGAIGGELALASAVRPMLAVRGGAFGERQVEGAARRVGARAVWQGAAGWQQARNDFPFTNAAGERPVGERRVNNDETRMALAATGTGTGWQLAALATVRDRGMVGPANVRAFDGDRARTGRLLLRGRRDVAGTRLLAGGRWMSLAYRDPARPVMDREAVAMAADVEWEGARHGIRWRAGGGLDRLAATGGVSQRRERGSAAVEWRSSADAPRAAGTRATAWELGARLDAITALGVIPGGTVAVEHRLWQRARASAPDAAVHVTARVATALRAPTLYDLYFAAPQRLVVAPLAPERVRGDAALGLQATGRRGGWQWLLAGEAVARDVRDAIVWFPGNFGWSPANVGRERLRGAEARAEAVHPRARLALWATRHRAELRAGGLRIPTPYVPVNAGGGQLQWRTGGTTLSLLGRALGRRPFTAGPRSAAFELPAVVLVDLAVARRLPAARGTLLATASLDNATNRAWEPVRGYPAPGRAVALALTWSPQGPSIP